MATARLSTRHTIGDFNRNNAQPRVRDWTDAVIRRGVGVSGDTILLSHQVQAVGDDGTETAVDLTGWTGLTAAIRASRTRAARCYGYQTVKDDGETVLLSGQIGWSLPLGPIALPIQAADHSANTVTLDGNWLATFIPADTITISGSTANDGTYTVAANGVTYSSAQDRTTVLLTEALTDSTADGTVTYDALQSATFSNGYLDAYVEYRGVNAAEQEVTFLPAFDFRIVADLIATDPTSAGTPDRFVRTSDLFAPVTTWTTATYYSIYSGHVRSTSGSYRCILAHTSGATTEPGVGASWATYWTLVAADGTDGTFGTRTARVYVASNIDTGATLTTADDETLVNGDVIVLGAQTAPEENGPWEWDSSGETLSRPSWWTGTIVGTLMSVSDGTYAGATVWARGTGGTVDTDDPDLIGTFYLSTTFVSGDLTASVFTWDCGVSERGPVTVIDNAGAVQYPQISFNGTEVAIDLTGFTVTGTWTVKLGPVAINPVTITMGAVTITMGGGNGLPRVAVASNNFDSLDLITTGAFRTVPLSSMYQSDGFGLSMGGNQITIPPGTYVITGWSSVDSVGDSFITQMIKVVGGSAVGDVVKGRGFHNANAYAYLTCTGFLTVVSDVQIELQIDTIPVNAQVLNAWVRVEEVSP